MASHIDWYLIELERELTAFPEERRHALLVEVENHLREQMSDMVEIGMSHAIADQESVLQFGEPSEFAKRILGTKLEHPAPNLSLKGSNDAIAGYVLASFIFALLAGFGMHQDEPLWVATGTACLVVMGFGSFVRSRINLGSFLACSAILTVFVASGMALTLVEPGKLDGRVAVPRSTAFRLLESPESMPLLTGPMTQDTAQRITELLDEGLQRPFFAKFVTYLREGFVFSTLITGMVMLAAAMFRWARSKVARLRAKLA